MALKNGGLVFGGGGGGGAVNSVGAGFGLEFDSSSTATNPILRTKQTTTDFTSAANRALLDGVNLASGIYRTLADTNNPANAGVEDWIVNVQDGDTGQGSVQYWSRCTSTPKVFIRSVDTNSVYGSFVEITNQTYTLPSPTASTLGGVKSNAGTNGQFVNGIASDGSLQYATPAGGGSALIFSQRNPRQLFSTSNVSQGNTTVTFGVDVTGLYTPGYLFAFLPRPTSTIFTVVSATFSNGVSTVTFSPAANDTYPSGTQMWEVAQNTPTIVAEGAGIEFDEEGSLTIISLNPPTTTTLGGISTGAPTTGQFVQGVNSDGSLKYAVPPNSDYQLPVEMVSMPTSTGVDYIVDQSSAQAQVVTAIVENINPTSTIRLNTDIPDFPNDRYVALADTTGRLIIGIYATSAATGLGYAVVNALRQSRDHLFTATGNYTMTAYLLITGTSSIFTSGGFSTIPSTRTSQVTFGAGINATVDPSNPNAVVLDSRQSNWTVGNVGDPTFIENKFTNNVWITNVIKTNAAAAIGDSQVSVAGNFTIQIIPNTSTIRFGITDTQNYNVTSVSYNQETSSTLISFEPALLTTEIANTNVRLLSALTPASMTFDTNQFYLESDASGKQTIRSLSSQTPSSSGTRAVVAFDITGQAAQTTGDEILSFAFSSNFAPLHNGNTWFQSSETNNSFTGLYNGSSFVLAGSNSSVGIYRSTDNGQTFTQTAQTTGNWYAFALSPNGSQIIACGDGGILKSTDNGLTWSAVSGTAAGASFFAVAASSTTMVATSNNGNGIYRSTDNGNTWSVTGATSSNFTSVAVNSSGLFVAGNTSTGVWVSSNQGQTWTRSTGRGSGWAYGLGVGANNRFILLDYNNGLYYSDNPSTTWTASASSVSSPLGFYKVNDNLLLVGTAGSGIYKSTDNGVTWSQTSINSGTYGGINMSGANLVAASDYLGIWLSTSATSLSLTLPSHNSYPSQNVLVNNLVATDNATSSATKLQTAILAVRPTYTTSITGNATLVVDTNSTGNITDTTLIQTGSATGTLALTITQGGATGVLPSIVITDVRDGSVYTFSPKSGNTYDVICNEIAFGETLSQFWFSVSAMVTGKTRLILESTILGDISAQLPTMVITNPNTLTATRSVIATGSGSGSGGGGGSYVLPVANTTSIGGVKANAGEANQFVNGIASDGSLTYATPAGGSTNAVLLGTNTYSTADITAINGGNGKFTLGSNATGAIEMSTKTLVSSPTALPAALSGIQVGVHVLPSPATIAVVTGNNVNFTNNLTNPTQTILSPNAQTMAGAVASGSVIVSSDVDEDNALWVMIDYSETDFKLVKLSFSNYSTTPTFISSNVFTIIAPSQQFIGEINEFGITKVSTGNYKIVMTGTATGTSSDAARVYTANVTLSGSTLTVSTPSVLGPQLPNAVYCTKISNTYGIYAASLSGGQIWKLNSTSTAWNLLYTINPSDQSSQMQIDRSNGNVWAAFDTEEVVRIDQNNNVTQFPKSTLLNWTNVDQGQNTWGIIANGQTASIITYATLTSTSVNANYLLTLSSNAVVKVLDDLQLTNQIIDSVGSQGTSGQVLTVVNNNPTWASPRNVLVFQLAANTGSTAQVTIPFPAAPFITIGKPFGTMNNGVFTASRNVNVRMDFVYNVNATVDAWGTINGTWTTGNRYMQLSANDLKGSVSQIVPMNAGDTFQYRANNAVMWFGGSGTGTYLEMEALD